MAERSDSWLVENGALVLPGGGTYTRQPTAIPLSEITGTRIQRQSRWSADALFCIAVGLGTGALGFVTDFGPITFVLGAALVAIGVLIALLTKPAYALLVSHGGVDIVVIKDRDRAKVAAAQANLDRHLSGPT